jgi:hypothetical protein
VLPPSAVRPKFAADAGTKPWNEDPETVNDGDERPDEVYVGPVKPQNASPMAAPRNFTDIQGLLCSIPILTDQGSALGRFIREWGLTWKICHRHIIESIGSHTVLGGWAANLLRCFDEAEWQREVEVVKGEMKRRRGEWNEDEQGYGTLLLLLGDPQGDPTHVLADRRRWALWERHGIPTTTNSVDGKSAQDANRRPDKIGKIINVRNPRRNMPTAAHSILKTRRSNFSMEEKQD